MPIGPSHNVRKNAAVGIVIRATIASGDNSVCQNVGKLITLPFY
jgi:hypothetical protein